MDMIDQIGGWRSVGGVGASYGEGYGLDQINGPGPWTVQCKLTG